MRTDEVKRFWILEWHPKGGIAFHQVLDVLHRNWNAALEGKDVGWHLVGIFPDMESAQEGGRQLKRAIREKRSA